MLGMFVGYLALGKGFAYFGLPPVFIGEVALVALALVSMRSELALPTGPSAITASIAWTQSDTNGSGIATTECKLDAGAWGACSSPKALSTLAEYAADRAGGNAVHRAVLPVRGRATFVETSTPSLE